MDFKVGGDFDGVTLKVFLKRVGLSSKLVSHLKNVENGITVNGEPATVRRVLSIGDTVSTLFEDTEETSARIKPVKLPITVLYEDGDLIAVSKPCGMPTHISHQHYDDTLANALAFYFGEPFVFRPVNRLDRDTSGVVIVAKNTRAASILSKNMVKGQFEKRYIAVVQGEMTVGDEFTVDKPLCRSAKSIIIRKVCDISDEGAQNAVTNVKVIASGGGYSLLGVAPKTGRTHQIRVHLAFVGHPIVGDDLYGEPSEFIDRQALHAAYLSFPSVDGEKLVVTAPLPTDICSLLEKIGLSDVDISSFIGG